ncbi:protease, partial [Streptomyces sp. NPDC079189]
MDDGKPTGPKAKWWSRPTPGHTTTSAPESAAAAMDAPVEDARPADTPARPEPVAPGQPVAPAQSITPELVAPEPKTPAQSIAPEPVVPAPAAPAPAPAVPASV